VIRDDPVDDAVLACAIGAFADLILSGDHHLQLLAEFRGIAIVNASELLSRIGAD
jgi:predicted nucleic acid-binding protein